MNADRASTMNPTHHAGLALAAICAAVLGLILAPTAFATTIRSQVASFGVDGTSGTSFGDNNQLAFDQANKRLYVLDRAVPNIHGFDVSTPGVYTPLGGNFPIPVAATGGEPDIAVDNTISASSGRIYYASESDGEVFGFDAAGTPLEPPTFPNFPITPTAPKDICGSAVDSAGNIWIGDFTANKIRKYDSTGVETGSVDVSSQSVSSGPCHVAFDSNDDMYVAMFNSAVWKYTAPGYTSATQIAASPGRRIAVDTATDHLFVAGGSSVAEYDASGTKILTFANIPGASFAGITVNPATDNVYVSDTAHKKIQVFTQLLVVPNVTTGPASNVTKTSATLSGTVNPDSVSPGDALTDCTFEYGTTTSYGQTAPCVPAAASIPTDTADHAVTADLSGLIPGTAYHYRLTAANAHGTVNGADQTFFSLSPPVIAEEKAWSVSDTTATLAGGINPKNSIVTDCHFDWGTTSSYGNIAPCSQPNFGVNEVQTITIKASGGQFNLTINGETTNDIAFDATAATVQTELRALSSIGSPNVTVSGGPGNSAGSSPYVVTFVGSLASKDVEQIALGDGTVPLSGGNGSSVAATSTPGSPVRDFAAPVTADIGGLSPSTIYHFRLVAENGADGPQNGVDTAFTTRPSAVFPQRGYELVSAFDTNGIPVIPNAASLDGEHFIYQHFTPVPGSQNGGGGTHKFRASRNPDGSWTQQYIGPPPGTQGESPGALFSVNDLSVSVWGTGASYDPDDQNGGDGGDLYRRSLDAGSVTWLSRDPRIPFGNPQTDPRDARDAEYVSPDGRRVIFASVRELLDEDLSTDFNKSALYLWDEGSLSLVSVMPGFAVGFPGNSRLGSVNGEELGGLGGNSGSTVVTSSAVSSDASRIVFESDASPGGINQSQAQRLYVRVDGAETVEASASSVDPTPLNVNFWGADANVENVFFTSSSPLTLDSDAPDTAGSVENFTAGDLYRYTVPADGDPANGELIDLTPASGGAGVIRVLDISEDGRRLYFTANGVLAPGASPGDCGTRFDDKGACNLYLAEIAPDGSVQFTFIARGTLALSALGQNGEKVRAAVANADGSALAFRSRDALVPGRQTGGFPQVFLYQAGRDELSCASCPSDGSVPVGPATLTPSSPILLGFRGDYTPYASEGFGAPRELGSHEPAVSSDGTLFFQTRSSLLAGDVNGTTDVYEYRGGKLRLISSGIDAGDSNFAGASVDGSTVFFVSPGAYVGGIEPGIVRLYAARVGGGFTPPLPEPPCTGEDCKPVATAQPNYAAPSTSTIAGRGNLVEKRKARCRKGKARRKGGCVRKPARANRNGGAK
jgi:hypothetical protein